MKGRAEVIRTSKDVQHSIRSLFRRRQEEQQLHDELQFHLERQIEQNLAAGMPPQEARYAALRLLGQYGIRTGTGARGQGIRLA
jgi:hypothetical protein